MGFSKYGSGDGEVLPPEPTDDGLTKQAAKQATDDPWTDDDQRELEKESQK